MNSIWNKLRERIKKNKGNNILICGEPGIGKSHRGMRVSELLDFNGFNETKIVFNAEDFLHYLNTILKKRDSVLWDENIGAEAGDWYTKSNKAIKRSMNIMRKKGFTFIQCLPSIKDLDPKVRRLFHYYIEPLTISSDGRGAWCLFQKMQYNPREDRIYFKMIRTKNLVTGKMIKKHPCLILEPCSKTKDGSQSLIDWYEKFSEDVKDSIHLETENIIKEEKKKNQRDWQAPPDLMQYIPTVKANIEKLYQKKHPEELDTSKVAAFCNVGIGTAKRIISLIDLYETHNNVL